MPGPTDLIIWFLGTAFELLFVVCSLTRKSFLRYFFLNLYLLLSTTMRANGPAPLPIPPPKQTTAQSN